MTVQNNGQAAYTFWSERPLSLRERSLLQDATPWIERALAKSGRPVALLTLTCKQALVNEAGVLVPLTLEILWDALEAYFRRIDKLAFRNAARRFQKGVERFVVVEGGGSTGKRIHVHMLVAVPPSEYIAPQAFIGQMLATWRSSPWGRHDNQEKHDVDWQPVHDLQGAIQYVLKTGLDAVDWRSTRF